MSFKLLLLFAMLALIPPVAASAEAAADPLPFLSPIFTSNMVLQRGRENPMWGWTTPGSRVKVTFAGKTANDVAGPDGKWMIWLKSHPAGGPYTIEIQGSEDVHLNNVLVGDVWLCTGQSNMELGLSQVKNGHAEVEQAIHPNIRLFMVEHAWGATPQPIIKSAQWQVCSPDTVIQKGWGGFSAVGYFFGRDLQQAHPNVPIGLIETCWGGTAAEAWTTERTLETMPEFADVADRVSTLDGLPEKITMDSESWADQHDAGSAAFNSQDYDDSSWQTMNLPGQWAWDGPIKGFVGIVWFRKQFNLSAANTVHDAQLHLGKIADADTVWINGIKIGSGSGRDAMRSYSVPASALKTGENTVAVRVLNTINWSGGIWGDPTDLRLNAADGTRLDLSGPWRFHTTFDESSLNGYADRPPQDEASQAMSVPSSLYNGMIAPLVPYGIRGAIWYQGETNVGRAAQYQKLLPAMISDWRRAWGEGPFPFYIVQLTNYIDGPEIPGQSKWAELREAQGIVGRSVENSGSVVTIDIGDPYNIHSPDKQDVGSRLAQLARTNLFGEKLVSSGPVYKSMRAEGGHIRVKFSFIEGGLVAHGISVSGFEIAGADREFFTANAQIDGDSVVVSSPDVPAPVAVHYAWANSPSCNLFNRDGLPAEPFRTEDWPAATVK